MSLAAPLRHGSITLLVPAIQRCRAGRSLPGATVEGDGKSYRLENLVIAECSRIEPAQGGRPMERISLNYTKVTVRGWDPATKKE